MPPTPGTNGEVLFLAIWCLLLETARWERLVNMVALHLVSKPKTVFPSEGVKCKCCCCHDISSTLTLDHNHCIATKKSPENVSRTHHSGENKVLRKKKKLHINVTIALCEI